MTYKLVKDPVLFWTLSHFLIFENIFLSFISVIQLRSRIVKFVTHVALGKFLHKPLNAPDLIISP